MNSFLTMIKEFTQWATLMSPTTTSMLLSLHNVAMPLDVRLCAIYRVKGLVHEEAYRPRCVNPSWHILVKSRIVP